VVQGKIVASKDQPLEDVSVSVQGIQQQPVLTNENGEFEISVPSGNEWLIVSPVGDYKSKRIFLNGRTDLIVSLSEEDMKSGYDRIQVVNQNIRRRDVISPTTSFNMDKAKSRNIVSIDQEFQGQVPGMFTTNHSGMAGEGAVSFLRGIKSMNSSNAPLILIDGMPLEKPGLFVTNIEGNVHNPLSSINPSNISSINIIKSAPLTSLYGTKAANGVVLIKTLEPKSTQTTINVSLQNGFNLSSNNIIPQLNNDQYRSLANEILASSPLKEENFEDEYPGLYVEKGDNEYYRYLHNTQWQNLIFSNSLSTDANLTVKGGSDIAKYGLSVGYHDEGGIVKNTGYNRFNVRFVSDLNVFSWFSMKVNATLSDNTSYLRESAISTETNPIETSLSKPPIMDPYQYNEEGQKMEKLDNVDELGTSNPLAVVNNFEGENKYTRFMASIKSDANISKTLDWTTLFGLNVNSSKESVFMPNQGMDMYYGNEVHNVAQAADNQLFSFYTDNYLTYHNQFNALHELNTYVGFRLHTNSYEADLEEARNLPENDEYSDLQSGQRDLARVGGNNTQWNWLSVYNQVNYKYKDRYILNTGVSADFSTLTGNEANTAFKLMDYPFGLFYSVGAGWRISDESFLKQVEGLDNLMLRGSYGIAGNSDIGVLNSFNYYRSDRYRETSGLVPGIASNEALKYETNRQINAGMDLSLWGARTQMSVDYFIETTDNMLIYEPQKSYSGSYYKPTNGGKLQNTGVELSLFQRIIDGKRFEWDVTSSLTFMTNEVKDIKGEQLITSFEGGNFVTSVGQPVNSFYGYQFEGVFATQEKADEADLVNEKGIPFEAGDAKYKDISGPENQPDGVIDDYDKVNLGSPIPEIYGSLGNKFQYNRWTLDVMLQFVYGNEVFNYMRYRNERMVNLSNQSKHVLNRWQQPGDQTSVPRAQWRDPVGNSDFSSRWIEDGSYLRIKNIRLGYNIPEDFLIFRNAQFYVSATNLFTWDNYLGYDPEFSYSFDPMDQGIDYGLMPQFRQFLFGMNLGL
jgi:TonB-linked SusC/RagA family outer membrane protein